MYKTGIKSMLGSGNKSKRTESLMDFRNTTALYVGISSLYLFSMFYIVFCHQIQIYLHNLVLHVQKNINKCIPDILVWFFTSLYNTMLVMGCRSYGIVQKLHVYKKKMNYNLSLTDIPIYTSWSTGKCCFVRSQNYFFGRYRQTN